MKKDNFLKQKAANDAILSDKSEEQEKIAADSRAAAKAIERQQEEKKLSKEPQKKVEEVGKNVILNFRIPISEKEEWENFFKKLDYSMSLGIKKAVRYYIKEYQAGRVGD